VAGPFWYIYRGLCAKGLILLLLSIVTLGLGVFPVWLYCGYNANKDFYKYLIRKGRYIYYS
jgi:hypothetical protein